MNLARIAELSQTLERNTQPMPSLYVVFVALRCRAQQFGSAGGITIFQKLNALRSIVGRTRLFDLCGRRDNEQEEDDEALAQRVGRRTGTVMHVDFAEDK